VSTVFACQYQTGFAAKMNQQDPQRERNFKDDDAFRSDTRL